MKSRVKKVLSTILCCLLLLLILFSLSNFMRRKGSYIKNADFYSYEQDFDVLFLGSSHMVMGISPMELWNDYGIVSYNLANYGQRIPVDYWVLKNALDYTKPKLVVLDVALIGYNEKYSDIHISQMHEVFDTMPLSANKVSAVYDLLPKGKRMEFLFDFSYYHTRWSEIDSTFWKEVHPSTEKGGNLDNSNSYEYASVIEVEPPKIVDKNAVNMGDTIGKRYLRKIIELCKEENIDILLTTLPYVPKEDYQQSLNSVQAIADEYNINYLDFIMEDTFINYSTDFYNTDHLNSSGNRKTTKVLGAYLIDNYDLVDQRGSDIAEKWKQEYVDYTNYKVEWLKKQTELNAYLMLLADESFSAIVEIDNTNIWEDPTCTYLFENLGVNMELVTENTDYIVIREGGKYVEVIDDFDEQESTRKISIGEKDFLLDEIEEDVDMRIWVFDKDTLEIKDYAMFALSFEVETQKEYMVITNEVRR